VPGALRRRCFDKRRRQKYEAEINAEHANEIGKHSLFAVSVFLHGTYIYSNAPNGLWAQYIADFLSAVKLLSNVNVGQNNVTNECSKIFVEMCVTEGHKLIIF